MNIETYLEQNNVKQAEFAAKLGVTPSAVSQWVSGITHPSVKQARKIVGITGGCVSFDEIYSTKQAA